MGWLGRLLLGFVVEQASAEMSARRERKRRAAERERPLPGSENDQASDQGGLQEQDASQ